MVITSHHIIPYNRSDCIASLEKINYWRDKRGHEIDFVLMSKENKPIALECKWTANDFNPKNLLSFRQLYPEGNNYVVAQDVDRSYVREYRSIKVHFVGLDELVRMLVG